MKTAMRKRCKGQAIVEYIIIIVIVAIAALSIMGMFSDTLRKKIAGVTNTLGSDTQAEVSKSSTEVLKDLKETGLDEGDSN